MSSGASDVSGEGLGGEDWFFARVERRLAQLPITDVDEQARWALVDDAIEACRGNPVPVWLSSPEAHAELIHRLRFVLGPQVSAGTLAEADAAQERLGEELLAMGMSRRALGLDDTR